ncbi:hypothetical protein ABG775_21670 [Peribacillus simplex]
MRLKKWMILVGYMYLFLSFGFNKLPLSELTISFFSMLMICS